MGQGAGCCGVEGSASAKQQVAAPSMGVPNWTLHLPGIFLVHVALACAFMCVLGQRGAGQDSGALASIQHVVCRMSSNGQRTC